MFFRVKNENSSDLSTADGLAAGSVYSVSVFARNDVGESDSSNNVEYTSPQLGMSKIKIVL